MKIFFLDLWQDLQAKRLWPVAAGLLLALVAVPVVLSKSSDAPPPAPVQSVRKAPDPKDLKALASVKLDEAALERGSSLDTFDPSDPFRPPKAIAKRSREGAGGAPSTVTSDQPSGGSTAGDSGSTGGGAVSSGGGYTGSTGGGTAGGTGSTGGTGGSGGDKPMQTAQYHYVADVTFTGNGKTRHIKALERLGMLPNEASPLLLFLGVTASAGNAVFLVDSTLSADGEGKCKPKPSECAFLYLGAGSKHQFTNEDGDVYTLRIDEIRKVRIDGSAAAASRKKAKTTARAAVGAPQAVRRFSSPLISDLVTVSSGSDAGATDDQDLR